MAEAVFLVGWELSHGEGSAFREEDRVVAEAAISSAFTGYFTFTFAAGEFYVSRGKCKGYYAYESGSAGLFEDTLEIT